MTSTGEDPLIARMVIRRRHALHESCHRLRQLHPQCPRTYGVAILADVSKRRWFPLDSVFTVDRLRVRLDETAELTDRRAAGNVLAARLVHEVLGRLLPLVLLEGRAWDAGLENLWVHFDGENDIDWVAVVDPTVRVLPDDPWISKKGGRGDVDTMVVLPNESALTTWVAHRCHRTLAPLFVWLHKASEGAVSILSMWQLVGSAVVVAASQLPRRPEIDEARSFRRSQAVLDAMVGFGLPVRGLAVPARLATTSKASSRSGGQL
ncbi:iron reductase [Mycolicibacter longobardus]|uniref:Iron reductase n=1 Tax=Mycolicibacter longobardus TaxID=1108812 RepID=A0A1X1YQ60_9MYCO|nr:iron reductase [Mycolicibacter longobardus]MCV7382657.1 iron reductase [Mycolicibacter longobardus]ORW13173.1 iron reductase [Mycolicibacter longobardus]